VIKRYKVTKITKQSGEYWASEGHDYTPKTIIITTRILKEVKVRRSLCGYGCTLNTKIERSQQAQSITVESLGTEWSIQS